MTADEFARLVIKRFYSDFNSELMYDDLMTLELTETVQKLAACYLTRARNHPKYLVMNAKMGTTKSTKYCRYICTALVERSGGWDAYNRLGGIVLARALIRTLAEVDPEKAAEYINECAIPHGLRSSRS